MTEPVRSSDLFDQAIRRAIEEQIAATNSPPAVTPEPAVVPVPPFQANQAGVERRAAQVEQSSNLLKQISIWGFVVAIASLLVSAYGDVIKDLVTDDTPAVVEVIKNCPELQDQVYEKQRQNPAIIRNYGGEIQAQCHLNEIAEQARRSPKSDLPGGGTPPNADGGSSGGR